MAGCQKATVSVKIDTDNTKEPISEYIYGQFIEHPGRCIYGGIWAEMLEDLKFFYVIKDDYNPWAIGTDPFWKAGEYKYLNASPWKVIGPAGSVTMDSLKSFIGKYTPVIHLPGDGTAAGISQEGLGILQDKNYEGRIVLAGDKEALPIMVQLVLGSGEVLSQKIESIQKEFTVYPLEFKAPSTDEKVSSGLARCL